MRRFPEAQENMEPTFALEVGTRSLGQLPNFRPVGLPCPGRPLLYRSGYVERLSADGVQELSRSVGIRCILDLRGARELRRTLPGSHVTQEYRQLLLGKDGSVRDLDGVLQEEEEGEAESEVSNSRRYTIDFLGVNFRTRMFLRLPTLSKLSIGWSLVTSLYTGDRGYEAKAAEIILKPRGLSGQCCDFADFCHGELAAVLRVLAVPRNLPCLVHCFLGKDRTGLVAMLVQWLVGVSREQIEEEYQMSGPLTEEVRQEAVRYYSEKNLPASFASCSLEELRVLMKYIETKYGGVESYLKTIGLTQDEIDQLRANFGKDSTVSVPVAAKTEQCQD